MPTGPTPLPRVDLARVVDLADRLEADHQLEPETLRERDRTLGRELADHVADATARVEAWLDRLRTGSDPTAGERAQRAERTLRALLIGVGGALGVGAALAFFRYDGTHPVNVVQVLAFFVALQAVLLIGTAILALPETWRSRVPGLAAVQDVLRLASPGRWQPALRRALPAAQRDALERASGLARRHQRLYGDVQKWSLLALSQWFALSFHAAAWATAAALVTFSDLAFGWSTTLDVSVAEVHRIADALARPWSTLWPEAVPSLALVEQTQYFRGQGGLVIDALDSAAWWRFVLAAMALYGALPRLVALVFVSWRRSRALDRAFRHLPGVAALRDRLDSRWVSTGADRPERRPAAEGPAPARAPQERPTQLRAVRWSGLPLSEADVRVLLTPLGAELVEVLDGGAGSRLGDAELVAALGVDASAPTLLVKGWEPPLGELLDWLDELRAALGDGRPILVVPVEASEGDAPGFRFATGRMAETWVRRLDRAGDPWLEVIAGSR
ncbi:MAG: DUF2868 domain-containing protein [Myxococcota bacterium]